MTHTRRSTMARYGVAVLASGAAELVRLVLSPVIMPSPFLSPLYGAVLLSAWYGGLGPGLLAVGSAVVAVAYLFLPLSYPLAAGDWLVGARIGLFALTSVLLAWITTLRLTAREGIEEELRQAQSELETRVAERTAELSRINATLSEEIGERERTEETMLRSKAMLESFMQNSPAGAFLKDEAGRYVYVNPVCERNSKRPAAEWLGRTDAELWGPEAAAPISEHDATVLATNAPLEVVESLVHAHGRQEWLSLKFPVLDLTGRRLLGGVGVDITELKRVEAELRQSEERFALAVAGSMDGLWDWNAYTNELYLSPRCSAMLGFESDAPQLSVMEWEKRVHPDDIERRREAFSAHASGQTPFFEDEHRVLHSDGTYRWVRARGMAVRDASGKPLRIAGSIADISTRKRIEDGLRESELKFRTLAETTDAAIFIAQGDRTLYVNPASTVITGYTHEELLSMSYFEVIHPDFRDIVRERGILRERGEDVLREYEIRIRRKDGTDRWVHFGGGLIEFRGSPAVLGTAFDITERRQAEEQLRQSELQFRTLAETVSAAIVIHYGGELRYVNPATVAITGYSRDELLSMAFWEVIHPEFQETIRTRGLARLRGETVPSNSEIKLRRKDGSERWVDFTGGTINFEGRTAVLGTAFDITERKRAEEMARHHQAELAHVSRVSMLGEMAGGLAHEINQPLAAIVNYARGCVRRLEGDSPPGELRGTLDAIAAEALRAAEIIRRIRRLARKEPPRRDTMDLNQLVADAARLMEADSQEHGVTMRLDLAPGLPPVDVDGIQIQQVCVNLVRNGFEAMSPVDGGTRELLIRTSMPQPDTVEVAVCDAGVGLPAELGDHVFDAFVSTKSSGLGMGLSISRSIIEAHGGRLWATANTERGATFRFTLTVPGRETSHAE